MIWPKPFDLGVSQRLEIVMTPDPETGEFKAGVRLERLTGTREAWLRLNKAFVADLRRHFLHWRAVFRLRKEVAPVLGQRDGLELFSAGTLRQVCELRN